MLFKIKSQYGKKFIAARENARIASVRDEKQSAALGARARGFNDEMSAENVARRNEWARIQANVDAGFYAQNPDFDKQPTNEWW